MLPPHLLWSVYCTRPFRVVNRYSRCFNRGWSHRRRTAYAHTTTHARVCIIFIYTCSTPPSTGYHSSHICACMYALAGGSVIYMRTPTMHGRTTAVQKRRQQQTYLFWLEKKTNKFKFYVCTMFFVMLLYHPYNPHTFTFSGAYPMHNSCKPLHV